MASPKDGAYGLRSKVEHYFERQAEQLLSQSQEAASLSSHSGTVGTAGEEAVRSFLRRLLPQQYGIGAGHIVSMDGSSAQVDVIIFDKDRCFSIPVTDSASLYSIEGVYAALEIKSSPTRRSNAKTVIRDAVANLESINRIVRPLIFSFISGRASGVLPPGKATQWTNLGYPVTAIVILGAGSEFEILAKYFRSVVENENRRSTYPDLFCVIDTVHYGLCGFDLEEENPSGHPRFWKETSDTAGETLATFLYWLVHKMTFERVIERPVIDSGDIQAVWPSVLAPVVRRIRVSNTGNMRSFPWPNETRQFE